LSVQKKKLITSTAGRSGEEEGLASKAHGSSTDRGTKRGLKETVCHGEWEFLKKALGRRKYKKTTKKKDEKGYSLPKR